MTAARQTEAASEIPEAAAMVARGRMLSLV